MKEKQPIDPSEKNRKDEKESNGQKTAGEMIKGFFKKTLLLLLLLVALVAAGYYMYATWTYSTGTRTGYLIKISKKGYLFKTYEGQLNLGGFSEGEGAGMIGNIWNFSIKEEEVYRSLENMEGAKVTLHYKEINKAFPWQGDTNYFVYEAEKRE